VVIYGIPEPAIKLAIASSHTMIASDGLIEEGKGHPRGAGTFSRVLGRYVREERALPLMEAVRKMTLLPGATFGKGGCGDAIEGQNPRWGRRRSCGLRPRYGGRSRNFRRACIAFSGVFSRYGDGTSGNPKWENAERNLSGRWSSRTDSLAGCGKAHSTRERHATTPVPQCRVITLCGTGLPACRATRSTPYRMSGLQPAIKPGKGFFLHLLVELMRPIIEARPITLGLPAFLYT
jgi:hypothetical protein